jgi:hypothetical protein
MVIEILSPSTTRMDRLVKFNHYLDAGVREYWIVDPDAASVQVYILDEGKFIASAYGITDPKDKLAAYTSDQAPVSVLSGLVIDLKTVFPPQNTVAKKSPEPG